MSGHSGGWGPSLALSSRRSCRVSLTMIVRDEEANLPRCLASAEGLFDEIIVADTGSSDRTREIARSFGARVFDVTWADDFAAARNAALERASGDYAFWLDADESLDPNERETLRLRLDGLQPGGDSFYTTRLSGPGIPEPGTYQARLFPRHPGVRWTCRVHEVLWPSLRRAGLSAEPSGISLYHAGYRDPAAHARKRARNERILRAWLAESPADPFALWHAGRLAAARGDWATALALYRESLLAWPSDLLADAPRAYIAQAEWELGRGRAALQTCDEALALLPDHAPAWFAKGRMHHGLGDLAEAERCWRRVLALVSEDLRCMAFSDPRFEACRARRELASLALRRGDREEARRLYREILSDNPDECEARARLHELEPGRRDAC